MGSTKVRRKTAETVKQFLTCLQILHLDRVLAPRKLVPCKQLVEVTAMTEFQKIAIGLLGLTHPEMFVPRPKVDPKSTGKTASDRDSIEPVRRGSGRGARVARAFRFMFAALAVGSRTVALADNSQLRRDLGARARVLYGLDEG